MEKMMVKNTERMWDEGPQAFIYIKKNTGGRIWKNLSQSKEGNWFTGNPRPRDQ